MSADKVLTVESLSVMLPVPIICNQRITDLGRQAAEQMRTAASQEQNLERAERLRILAKQLDTISPPMLRHSLAKSAC
jgi:hypothetical protein